MIGEINRSILIARPKQPYLDWVHSLDDEGKQFTLEELRTDCTAFLVPPYEDDKDQEQILGHCFGLLFEEALSGWEEDEERWPAKRDLDAFREWFDVEFSSLAIDLVEDPIDTDGSGDEEE